MIRGPENQQIRPSARHNGEAELPVDVFEDRSSFFSVSTSLPPHTHMHLQHKPACNARSHAANEEARELCVRNTRAPLLHAGTVREVSEWRGVLCSLKPSSWLSSKVKVFRIVSRKRHEDGCDADAVLRKKQQQMSQRPAGSAPSPNAAEDNHTDADKTGPKVSFSASSAGEGTSESGKQDSSRQQMMCRGLAA